ncbi:MAG: DUF1294 domain-containing protein [Gammaproteobacteria bacterium]|nr:DUF1294 domain-containing protein [Gammaproteobacteria bacterium]
MAKIKLNISKRQIITQAMKQKGIITVWHDDKGYGFITPNKGKDRIFVHISAFKNKLNRPQESQVVTFELSTDSKGRVRATNAFLSADINKSIRNKNQLNFPITFALLFLVFLVLSIFLNKLPPIVLAIYLTLSIISYGLYWKDKKAAQNNRWRVPESTLHFLAIMGGWLGAAIAQHHFRHKTKKQPFRAIFWFTVTFNVGILLYLMGSGRIDHLYSVILNNI